MHILIDMDGVIAQWTPAFNSLARRLYPDIEFPFLLDNVNWNLKEGLDTEGREAVDALMAHPGFYAELAPVRGAKTALRAMVRAGHEVSIVTTPMVTNPTCASDKMDWLERHIGRGWAQRAVITHDKTAVRGDVLIDDRPEIRGYYAPTWRQLIFDATYNQLATGVRMTNWNQWEQKVEEATWQNSSDSAASSAQVRMLSLITL